MQFSMSEGVFIFILRMTVLSDGLKQSAKGMTELFRSLPLRIVVFFYIYRVGYSVWYLPDKQDNAVYEPHKQQS